MVEDLPLFTGLSFDPTENQDLIIPVLEIQEGAAGRAPQSALRGPWGESEQALGCSGFHELLHLRLWRPNDKLESFLNQTKLPKFLLSFQFS